MNNFGADTAGIVQGSRIRDYMNDIPSNCEPAPIIHAYIDLNLQTLESAGLIEPIPVAERTKSEGSEPVAVRPAGVDVTISLVSHSKSKALSDETSSQLALERELAVQQVLVPPDTILPVWSYI